MSVKFEKETVKTTEAVASAATGAAAKGKDGLLKDVGEALTKGGGINGYLAVSGARNRNRICPHVYVLTTSSCRLT